MSQRPPLPTQDEMTAQVSADFVASQLPSSPPTVANNTVTWQLAVTQGGEAVVVSIEVGPCNGAGKHVATAYGVNTKTVLYPAETVDATMSTARMSAYLLIKWAKTLTSN